VRHILQLTHGRAWGCSDCAWEFEPEKGPPKGDSLEEMKANYLRQRDREFAIHKCAEHPRTRRDE
jgi:hypothetical protein